MTDLIQRIQVAEQTIYRLQVNGNQYSTAAGRAQIEAAKQHLNELRNQLPVNHLTQEKIK